MVKFKIGQVVMSTRSWTHFTIARINEKEKMLIDADNRAIKFTECQPI
jgi:hypothetical protein